ncbi:hypothetical protein R1sor_007193 [Riccia sorocarpa]|uniref:Uncharacterized protein n=1 Tax=Riccia sorocarpa TaxID=122646 RepID=A0ABD3HPQ4_9MARC
MEGTTHNPIAIESDIEIFQHERIGDSQATANVVGAKSKKKHAKKRKTDSCMIAIIACFNLRIKGDSSKEQGIPGACDGGVHLRPPTEIENIGLTNEVHDFTDEVFNGSFMEAMGYDVEKEIPAAERFVTPPVETPVQTPPTTPEGDQSAANPRTKACSQPGVVGQKNKKRRASQDNDDGMKTCMLEFTQVVKEANERKSVQEDRKFNFMVAQEQGKMNLMSHMLELKRMELDILRNNQRGPPPSSMALYAPLEVENLLSGFASDEHQKIVLTYVRTHNHWYVVRCARSRCWDTLPPLLLDSLVFEKNLHLELEESAQLGLQRMDTQQLDV